MKKLLLGLILLSSNCFAQRQPPYPNYDTVAIHLIRGCWGVVAHHTLPISSYKMTEKVYSKMDKTFSFESAYAVVDGAVYAEPEYVYDSVVMDKIAYIEESYNIKVTKITEFHRIEMFDGFNQTEFIYLNGDIYYDKEGWILKLKRK